MPKYTIKRKRGEPGFAALATFIVSIWLVFYSVLFTGLILGVVWLAEHV